MIMNQIICLNHFDYKIIIKKLNDSFRILEANGSKLPDSYKIFIFCQCIDPLQSVSIKRHQLAFNLNWSQVQIYAITFANDLGLNGKKVDSPTFAITDKSSAKCKENQKVESKGISTVESKETVNFIKKAEWQSFLDELAEFKKVASRSNIYRNYFDRRAAYHGYHDRHYNQFNSNSGYNYRANGYSHHNGCYRENGRNNYGNRSISIWQQSTFGYSKMEYR